jgi:hypothetical protein
MQVYTICETVQGSSIFYLITPLFAILGVPNIMAFSKSNSCHLEGAFFRDRRVSDAMVEMLREVYPEPVEGLTMTWFGFVK